MCPTQAINFAHLAKPLNKFEFDQHGVMTFPTCSFS